MSDLLLHILATAMGCAIGGAVVALVLNKLYFPALLKSVERKLRERNPPGKGGA